MALHEARIRVKSGNKIQKVFSTQDIVECSPYSQGCDGGFPYLVGGKYAEVRFH
jgi:cathepsin C